MSLPRRLTSNIAFSGQNNILPSGVLYLSISYLTDEYLDVDKFLSLINPNLEALDIDCNYEKDKLHFANEWYLQCITKFKNIV